MTSSTFISVVKEYFPEASDDEAMGILWNYTGYPSFWAGEPETCLREQLQHLRDVGAEQVDREFDEAMTESEFRFGDASVAQRTEQAVPSGQVAGSIPAGGTAA